MARGLHLSPRRKPRKSTLTITLTSTKTKTNSNSNSSEFFEYSEYSEYFELLAAQNAALQVFNPKSVWLKITRPNNLK
jgi:hypothetical protein